MDKSQGFYDYLAQVSETSTPSNGLAFSCPPNTTSLPGIPSNRRMWSIVVGGIGKGEISLNRHTHIWDCYARGAWKYSHTLCGQSGYMLAGAGSAACTRHQEQSYVGIFVVAYVSADEIGIRGDTL